MICALACVQRAQKKQTSCVWSESTIVNLTAFSALQLYTVIPKKDMFRNELLNLHSNNFRRERVGHTVRCAAKRTDDNSYRAISRL